MAAVQVDKTALKQTQVIIDTRNCTLVQNAYQNLRSGYRLAISTEAMDMETLRKSKKGIGRLVISSKGLEGKEFWNLIVRKEIDISLKSINEKLAHDIIEEGRWYDVVYVSENVAKVNQSHPILLSSSKIDIPKGKYLLIDDYPSYVAWIAMVELLTDFKPQVIGVMHLEGGQTLEIVTRDNETKYLENVSDIRILERK